MRLTAQVWRGHGRTIRPSAARLPRAAQAAAQSAGRPRVVPTSGRSGIQSCARSFCPVGESEWGIDSTEAVILGWPRRSGQREWGCIPATPAPTERTHYRRNRDPLGFGPPTFASTHWHALRFFEGEGPRDTRGTVLRLGARALADMHARQRSLITCASQQLTRISLSCKRTGLILMR